MKDNRIFWAESYDKTGKTFGASREIGYKDAIKSAKVLQNDEGVCEVCIWSNRVDGIWEDQPNYSIDPVWMWKLNK